MNHKLLAQTLTFPDGTAIQGPAGFGSVPGHPLVQLGDLISAMIPYIFFFAGTAMLIMLILGGFSLLTGANDPKKIEQGQKQITFAILGFIIVFLAYWVVQLAARIFGLTEFKIFN